MPLHAQPIVADPEAASHVSSRWRCILGPGLILLLASFSCAHYEQNVPLELWEPHRSVLAMGSEERSREIVVMLAFSGGGTRAAALAYGVLEELSETWIEVDDRPRRLLDEIDIISAVSGGSFTAAYFGLFGDRIFEDYEERFLRRNVQGALIRRTFDPRNYFRLASARFGRSDLAAEYYDDQIFDHRIIRQFGDVPGPAIIINSTDLTRGVRFAFIREKFDPLCNDVVEYKVSRAVAASSAVPGLLSPILVRNHHGSCGYETPGWVAEALQHSRYGSRRYIEARVSESYLSPDAQPHIYLVDGGVTDNLGVRASFEDVVAAGSLRRILEQSGLGDAHTMVMIVVNAQNQPELDLDDLGFFRSLGLMAGTASGIQIRRFNYETLDLIRSSFNAWAREMDRPGHPFRFHLVEVSFAHVTDEETRKALNNLPTSFKLDDEEVDLLRSTARYVLSSSSEFDAALDSLGRWETEAQPSGGPGGDR
jgi:NTE family protein